MIDVFHCFISGLTQLFTGTTFGLMLLGIGIGFLVGILPGLGGPTTTALMLPFIVKMKAVEAFAFLLGMIAVTNTTGDLTSILFGVPGEPATAATIVDGHPMARRGEAGRAMGAALMSSAVGAIFGAFAMAIAIPLVRPLVSMFGSPEFFMISILGLTFVASLSGGSFLRSLIAAGIGLFLATIGADPQGATKRFTFGQVFLWDGIGLVPITIGFFAIPELIELIVHGMGVSGKPETKLGGVMEGVKDTFRHFWMVIRCSAIGTFTGIIPGLGGTSQWLAYAHAVQSSPDRERFGKGAVEGVLGPGAANNSIMGGTLVTTIAFSIPGGVGSALLLGAFIIQGLVPGPDMLIPEIKGGHLGLTFSFVWINIVSNIITVAVCFLVLNWLVKIAEMRANRVFPFILFLIYLGAFAEKNMSEDLSLVLIFGVLGWLMERFNWPRPPLILGLVLGPLAENRLFISIRSYDFAWLLRPGVLVLIGLTLAGALYPIIRAKLKKMSRRDHSLLPPKANVCKVEGTRRFRFNWAAVFTLFILVVFIFALWESRHFPFKAGLFPWVIGFPVLIFTLIQSLKDLMGKGSEKSDDEMTKAQPELPISVVNRRTAEGFAWISGLLLGIWLLGFSVAIPLCTFIYLKRSREKWGFTLIYTGFSWAFVSVFFNRLLHVPFPEGKLFLWL